MKIKRIIFSTKNIYSGFLLRDLIHMKDMIETKIIWREKALIPFSCCYNAILVCYTAVLSWLIIWKRWEKKICQEEKYSVNKLFHSSYFSQSSLEVILILIWTTSEAVPKLYWFHRRKHPHFIIFMELYAQTHIYSPFQVHMVPIHYPLTLGITQIYIFADQHTDRFSLFLKMISGQRPSVTGGWAIKRYVKQMPRASNSLLEL